MANFARLDENNVVLEVIRIDNIKMLHNGEETEERGISFLISLLPGTNWKQTSFNGNFRGKYASKGDIYDPENDVFIGSKPFESWILDEQNFTYKPPVPVPDDASEYIWDEASLNWKLYNN